MKKSKKIWLCGLMSALLLAGCSQETEQNTSGTTSSLGVSTEKEVIEIQAESTGFDQDVADLFQMQGEIADEICDLGLVEEVLVFLDIKEDGAYQVNLVWEGDYPSEGMDGVYDILGSYLPDLDLVDDVHIVNNQGDIYINLD